jgi:hypothetical protein
MVQLSLEGALAGFPHLVPSNQFPNGYDVDPPCSAPDFNSLIFDIFI